ncbi:MAG: DUF1552 domain-containing protein [Gemmatimonadetes bacterium]|nr:DUF1552 domain-containing protein [Gemmatimonadota bacterium]
MEFLTGKHIPRRTFLRDASAMIGLPLLDAMLPPRLVARGWAARPPARLVCVEMVHGAAGSNELGASRGLWAPAAVGREFDLGPGSLKPLEPFREYLTIISNTDVRPAEAVTPQEIGGDHFRSSATFLTQAHPKQTEGSDVYVGTSLDQLYVQRFGQDTPIPSMQLCIENVDQAGGCAYGYACVYTDTISWASPTEPLPMIRDPRAAFEQLFGAGGTPAQRAARRRLDRSILDEVERRIQRIEAHNTSGEPRELPEAPAGVPDAFEEHVKLMFDLQHLAFLSDTTRVFSFKMGRDGSGRVYPESGINSAFHPASHHGGQEKRVLEFAKINEYHVSMLPYFLEKLKHTMEGDQNLLDKTLVIYGSPMGDSNLHNHKRCPLFLVGRANGQLKGGEHIKAPDGTAMANVMLSLLHKLGLNDVTGFGDSTGDFSFTA